jgi:hypothetical protein
MPSGAGLLSVLAVVVASFLALIVLVLLLADDARSISPATPSLSLAPSEGETPSWP